MDPKTILCINDDRDRFVSAFRSYFEERGYRVLAAPTGMEGLRLLKEIKVDAVVLDYEAPAMSGTAALQVIKGVSPQTQVLILSGAKSKISPDVRHAASAVLMKAFSVSELMRNVERILTKDLPVGFSNYLA
jgi:DNA-binding response OmpR family regulator